MARKIIFDTDPGVDDTAAILFAHRHPAIDLVGVTTVFGNATIDNVTANALYLKEVYGFDAPVAKGAGASLDGFASLPPGHIHGDNGLGNVPRPAVLQHEADPRPAYQFIIDMVRAHPHEITLVTVGRLTNIALAMQAAPDIVGLVEEVIMMGGAFGWNGPSGNVTPVAEANIIGDAKAADMVFTAPWKVTAISLDVTRDVHLTLDDYAMLRGSEDAACRLMAEVAQVYIGFHERFGVAGSYVHDSSALAYLVAPELFTTRQGGIRVVTEGIAVGQTVFADPAAVYPPGQWDNLPLQSASVSVDAAAVRVLLLDTITGKRA